MRESIKTTRPLLKVFVGEDEGAFKAKQLRYYGDTVLSYVTKAVSANLSASEAPTAILLRKLNFTMATGDTLEGQILAKMGLQNQAANYSSWSYPKEKEPDLNPNIIFYHSGMDVAQITASNYYKLTSAVKNQKLYPVDMTAFERQSPYMFQVLESMARTAFPEALTAEKPSVVLPELLETRLAEKKKWFFF